MRVDGKDEKRMYSRVLCICITFNKLPVTRESLVGQVFGSILGFVMRRLESKQKCESMQDTQR